MKEKMMNSRIQHKIDTEENWSKATFAPLKGELIIYAPDENYDYPRFKVGDGETPIGELKFSMPPVAQIISWEDEEVWPSI